jgi:hypothetical protein
MVSCIKGKSMDFGEVQCQAGNFIVCFETSLGQRAGFQIGELSVSQANDRVRS